MGLWFGGWVDCRDEGARGIWLVAGGIKGGPEGVNQAMPLGEMSGCYG
jgi:hypothetical protein